MPGLGIEEIPKETSKSETLGYPRCYFLNKHGKVCVPKCVSHICKTESPEGYGLLL